MERQSADRWIGRGDGARQVRPLWDEGWGAERAARRARRLGAYVSASRLLLDERGHAEARLQVQAAGAKGAAHADAAAAVAEAFGVEAVRKARALAVHGDAQAVARFVAALPRVLDYAEQLATQCARTYGRWARSAAAEEHLEWLDERDRRARARQFRAQAFPAVVEVLAAAEDSAAGADVQPERAPWQQVEAIAGGIARYGWVDVREAYDPADVRELLAAAAWVESPAEAAEQLALPFSEQADEAPQPAAAPVVVVIPCSGAKLPTPAEAGRIYTGALHTHARKTADALTAAAGGTVLILSALHGLLTLDQVIQPYNHRWTDPGSISEDQLREQAAELGLADAAEVVLLTPSQYTRRAAAVWPHARTPLAHLGIGQQRGRLTEMRRHPEQYAVAA
ncbi:DUF6884 domain-containing protein [Kitasatospora sp. NPDC059648]|uniref:DUF6884 domain-containing protein n=1 Tax=Kitasatospora sp. NPDC059648 TaxID=3346894 RepID=UPI0036A302BF